MGIAGCGRAARIHADRLLACDQVTIVGCADREQARAEALADRIRRARPGQDVTTYPDHRELLHQLRPDALGIFTPHRSHYRLAMDALQAGCHVFIEKPLSTNLQEAADIVGLARGRNLKVAVGHQYRLCPSFREARRLLGEGAIGELRLVTAVMAQPWLEARRAEEETWRSDPKVAGGGILADTGDHLIDTLLWTAGQPAREAAAVQSTLEEGLDVVTAAIVRLSDGTPANLGISGVSPGSLFELNFFGTRGRIRATEQRLEWMDNDPNRPRPDLPPPSEASSIDGNFVAALTCGSDLCCPADQALDTVRLIEAIARSAATGQFERLV
jgi:predicted dehydrogenase